MPATPVLSNGGTKRGLPISCFLNEASDSLGGILDLWSENVWLAAKGWRNRKLLGQLKIYWRKNWKSWKDFRNNSFYKSYGLINNGN